MPGSSDLRAVGAAFAIDGTWLAAEPLRQGHIHRTFVATFDQGGARARYVHQEINEEIFADVSGLMRNFERVTAHLAARARAVSGGPRWEVPHLVSTRAGDPWWRAPDGVAWRTFRCIENTRTFDVASTPEIARAAAAAFGRFARDLADFDPALLVEPIPRFHDLEGRLAGLRRAVREDPVGRASTARSEIDAIQAQEGILGEFRALTTSGRLPLRVAHNDTKVNNALLDDRTGAGVAVIDLDTVMPGTLLFDYGDLVRTATCRSPEDERDLSRVSVDADLFAAVTDGWVREIAAIASSAELAHLLLGGRFMAYIIGVRFLTDHLEGDPYFGAQRAGQNLDRARVQLALLRSLESDAARLDRVIRVSASPV